jgi:N-acetylglutamate synthase-like GNAT family acetyltransferase
MIIKSKEKDFKDIYNIINDASLAYKGVIPTDMWHEPYMSEQELRAQIDDGVEFWCYVDKENIVGVMGIQDKSDVVLIRHAYVRTTERNKGIGGELLRHLSGISNKSILIGTWAVASWAIEFYKKHGFQPVSFEEKEILLRKYWKISVRQIDTSVVLAASNWKK